MALIRRARADDAAGIAQVHVASWRSTYPGMVPDSYLLGLSTDAYTSDGGPSSAIMAASMPASSRPNRPTA